jgi:hypothetical protein
MTAPTLAIRETPGICAVCAAEGAFTLTNGDSTRCARHPRATAPAPRRVPAQERAGQLVLDGLADVVVDEHAWLARYPTGEQAACEPCLIRREMSGDTAVKMGVTYYPGLRVCMGCWDRHRRAGLGEYTDDAPHHARTCPVCTRRLKPQGTRVRPAESPAEPVDDAGEATETFRDRWDRVTGDRRADERWRARMRAIAKQAREALRDGRPVLRLAVAMAAYRRGRTTLGRRSYVERAAAMMVITGNHYSGTEARPGRNESALLWDCSGEAMRSSWRTLEGVRVPVVDRDSDEIREVPWCTPLVRVDENGQQRRDKHGRLVYAGGAISYAERLATRRPSNDRNEWTLIGQLDLATVDPDLLRWIERFQIAEAARELIAEVYARAMVLADEATLHIHEATRELEQMSARRAELRAIVASGRTVSRGYFLHPPGGTRGEYVSSCLSVGLSSGGEIITRFCAVRAGRPDGREEEGASRSPIKRVRRSGSGPHPEAFILARQIQQDLRFRWLWQMNTLQLAATVSGIAGSWTVDDLHELIEEWLHEHNLTQVRQDLVRPLAYLKTILKNADITVAQQRKRRNAELARVKEHLDRQEARAASPIRPRTAPAGNAEVAKLREKLAGINRRARAPEVPFLPDGVRDRDAAAVRPYPRPAARPEPPTVPVVLEPCETSHFGNCAGDVHLHTDPISGRRHHWCQDHAALATAAWSGR